VDRLEAPHVDHPKVDRAASLLELYMATVLPWPA
jgi:hypothetical protein